MRSNGRAPRPRVPAVVVGLEINGLGVARSLARGGAPVTTVASPPFDAARLTRLARTVAVERLEGPGLVPALLALRERLAGSERPFLVLTTEPAVLAAAEAGEELSAAFRFRQPPPELTRTLMTKPGFQTLAEAGGQPVPPTVHVRGEDDFAPLDRLRWPCIVKPARRDPAYDARFARGYKVADRREAEALCREILPVFPNIVVQEWIEGDDNAIHFCLQYRIGSRAVTSFVGRKLRAFPPRVGVTASCLPAPEVADELTALTDAFFAPLGVEGFCSMELKRDARTGRFLMVEPTVGRTDWQEEIATLNGVNLPLIAYCHEIGCPPPPAEPGPPVAWRYWLTELLARQMAAEAGAAIPKGMRVRDAYWRLEDPLPAVVNLFNQSWRWSRHQLGRLTAARLAQRSLTAQGQQD